MIKKLLTLCLLLNACFLTAQKTKILFIGNSYTYVNDLPQTLHDLALAKGDTVIFDSSAPGGYSFANHVTNATTLSKINQQPWDFVVLQEQSQMPSFPPSQVATDVYPFAKRLDSLVKVNNACSEILFYMTWGRKNGDAGNCAGYPPVCTFNGMNARLRESYLQMAMDNNASVSPVGVAWKKVRDNYPSIELYQLDESHPSVQGTYLAACVFYASFFHKSPVNATYIPTGITTTEAFQLQTAAASTVLDSLNNWQQHGNIPNADFDFSVIGNQVQFTNFSTHALNYQWQFGDGASSNQTNPTHTYALPLYYLASLIAGNTCKHYTNSDTIPLLVNTTGIDEDHNKADFFMAPNPATDYFLISPENKSIGNLKVINTLGEIIFSKDFVERDEKISVAAWPEGVYYATFIQNKVIIAKKIIKN